MTKIVLKFLLLLFVPFFAQARDTDSLRVLWVGNSFSYCNDLPGMVQKIASTQKVKLSCTRFLKGGERFSGHLKNKKLLQAIADGGWDYVVLQEQSTAPAMAYDNGAWCAPVGMAWRAVRSERPDCILYRPDCYHPAVPGSYLAANVIFTTILQRPYQTAFTAELPAEQAEYLQRTAQRTVLDNLVLLNIR